MRPPSERAIRALEALGGQAPVELVRAHLDWADGPDGARLAIDLAVVRGALERIELPDGRPGLRLVETRQEAGAMSGRTPAPPSPFDPWSPWA